MKQISIHDHRLNWINNEPDYFDVECTCGKTFEDIKDFNDHQKEELNKQLREQNIELEIV